MSMNKPSGFKGSSDTCSILKDFYRTSASSVTSSNIKSELSLKKKLGHFCVDFKSNKHHRCQMTFSSFLNFQRTTLKITI